MVQGAIMEYLSSAFGRMRLRFTLVSPGDPLSGIDSGLRAMLGLDEEYGRMHEVLFARTEPGTVRRLTDAFDCRYLFFTLPGDAAGRVAVVGPYLTGSLSREWVLEKTEQLGLPLVFARQLTEFYASQPVIVDTSMLLALISALGDTLWGSATSFETVDLNRAAVPILPRDTAAVEENRILMEMKNIELRYHHENSMMDAVSKGLLQQVEWINEHVTGLSFEPRTADPLRNTKNYCIICNTLLRKAAEKGGVHPLHVDRVSSRYAEQIETKATPEDCVRLIGEMFRGYCRLVRSHATGQYSAPVQNALFYMEENLSGDLGLKKLAQVLNLSPGYLSGLFHREMGKTVTQHVTDLRMNHALHLLTTTQLQVQHVAQLCGIPDANYFSKLFRKRYGTTPHRYRRHAPVQDG